RPEKTASPRSRRAMPSRRMTSGDSVARARASASCAVSLAGARKPVSPSRITSALPPTAVATTGRAAAIDSMTVFERPSLTDQSPEASKLWSPSAERLSARVREPFLDGREHREIDALEPFRRVGPETREVHPLAEPELAREAGEPPPRGAGRGGRGGGGG